VIEQAKGILMARHSTSADKAFEMLREHSQHNGHKLADVAAAVVECHQLIMPALEPGDSRAARLVALPSKKLPARRRGRRDAFRSAPASDPTGAYRDPAHSVKLCIAVSQRSAPWIVMRYRNRRHRKGSVLSRAGRRKLTDAFVGVEAPLKLGEGSKMKLSKYVPSARRARFAATSVTT